MKIKDNTLRGQEFYKFTDSEIKVFNELEMTAINNNNQIVDNLEIGPETIFERLILPFLKKLLKLIIRQILTEIINELSKNR